MSVKKIHEVLKATGCMKDGDVVTGLDETVKSSLTSYHAFKNMLDKKLLTETQVEEIITYITYSEDKIRLKAWLEKRYPDMSDVDRKYILNLKLKDFGRLSKKFLTGLEGIDKASGEMTTIIDAMWNTNNNLMQLLSDKFTFAELIEDERNEFYANGSESIDAMLDDMYISNSVKRPIYRTLAILDDIKKATKAAPKRIFIEMARGGGEKGKRTKSRRSQIEELYKNFSQEEVRELSKLLDEKSDNELQSEVLFLYFMQMGRCMYSGEAINIEELKTSKYNVDHIYPQSKVKDDSMSNKVLVLSTLNGEKGDGLVPSEVRSKMAPMWKMLKDKKMISEEKYRRLMRNVSFSDDELQGFINRQLVETSQATKALATILQRMYPETEIVYVKAGLVSDFRKEFDMLKSRQVNDLHHGKDAYLNIVCGNVYHCRFTKNFYFKQSYSLKTRTLFTHNVHEDKNLVWAGEESIAKVRHIMAKNNLHYTRFAFERKGGLFDQNPVKAGSGAIPRKENLAIEKYGGYNKATASFFVLVKYREGKKTDIMFMPVELSAVSIVMKDEASLYLYSQKNIAQILDKKESQIEVLGLPLGMRRIKINTIISLNGFKAAITGKSTGGQKLGLTSMEPLILGMDNEKYVKKLERYVEKKENKRIQSIDEKYDKITSDDNMHLFDLLAEKMQTAKYRNIFGGNYEYMTSSRDKFINMPLDEQVDLLMNVLSIFKTGRAGGCDLREIGGKKSSAVFAVSSKLSNMKKYGDIRLIDESTSGIYVKETDNLLELL